MNEIMEARFDRVDKALSTLIASLSTYNPSPSQAQDLLRADQELNDGLSLFRVNQHQQNHSRIQQLHGLSTSLDDQIHSVLVLLTTTRKNLLATPCTTIPQISSTQSSLTYQELLDYARRISKFTLPSDFREVSSERPRSANASASESAMEVDPPLSSDAPTPMTLNAAEPPKAGQSLPPLLASWLDPHRDYAFLPWPSENTIRRGALAMIQPLVQEGRSLEGWEAEKEVGKREEEMRAEEGLRKGVEAERERAEEARRGSADGGGLESLGAASNANANVSANVGGNVGQDAGSRVERHQGQVQGQGRKQFSLDELEDEDEEDDD